MRRSVLVVVARGSLLLASLGGASRVVWWLTGEPLGVVASSGGSGGLARLGFADALTGLCGAAVWLSWCWLSLISTLLVVHAVAVTCRAAGRRVDGPSSAASLTGQLADRLAPRLAQRFVLACCGVAVAGGLGLSPASADPPGHADPAAAVTLGRLSGLPVPDRAVGGAPGGFTRVRPPTTVTVRAGDSLWSIAERLLPPDASDHRVSAAWHRLYAANAGRIGTEPDLIFPGTALRVPPLHDNQGKEHP